MSSWSAETLILWKDALYIVAIVLTLSAGGVMYLRYRVEKELEYRRTAGEKTLLDQVAASKQDAEAARREAEKLQKRLKPRDVPTEQRESILSALRRAHGKVSIVYLTDPETEVLAKRLGALLREAGWDTTEEGAMSFGAIVGLKVEIHNESSTPPHANLLKEALKQAFPEVMIRVNKNVPEGAVKLVVGSRSPE